MRIRIIFSLQNRGAMIPFHHQYILADFIHAALREHDAAHPAATAYISFSGLKGQTKVSRAGLCFFSSKVTLVVSSPSADLVMACVRSIFEQKHYQLGQLELTPEAVAEEEELTFDQLGTKFICISPMILLSAQHDPTAKRFVPPDVDQFSDLLYESTMTRMEQSARFSAEQIASFYKFQVVPDQVYLDKVRAEDKKFARIYPVHLDGEKHEVRGYTMPFTLLAEAEVQRFVFECGLGELTYKGFGMLDVANSEPHKRARPLGVPATTTVPAPVPVTSAHQARRNAE